MPNTDILSDEDSLLFQHFIGYKLRRISEIGRDEYETRKNMYDNIFALEFEALQKKIKKNIKE